MVVRIPAGQFPDWAKHHRTLAQVARTVELRTSPRKLCALELQELQLLDDKATRFNPPPEPSEAGAA